MAFTPQSSPAMTGYFDWQPKNDKNIFLCLLNEKTEFIPSSEMKCLKSGIGTSLIIGWGESGKAILQVSIAIFSGVVKIFFGQRRLSLLEKKWSVRLWKE